jgi:hypothetical protein
LDLEELVIGGIVGAAFGYVLPKGYESAKERIHHSAGQRRRALLASPKLYEWVIRYYQRCGRASELYTVQIGDSQETIPLLTSAEWLTSFRVGKGYPPLVCDHGQATRQFSIDQRGLTRRERMGQRLFNAPALYFENVRREGERLQVDARRCGYYHVATSLLALEEETFKAVRSKGLRSTPVRDWWLGSPKDGRGQIRKPFSIAASVALVFNTNTGPRILLQTRSHRTVTYGGLGAVIPYFGVVPLAGIQEVARVDEIGEVDLLETNLAKEYCEELFSYDQLVEETKLRQADPRWFWTLPEAKEMRDMLDAGNASFRCLGFGFDGLNGSATLALMLMFDKPEFADDIIQRIICNWEVADRSTEAESIEFVDLPSPHLESLFASRRLTYGSAFTVGRTLQHLGLSPSS